MINSITVDLNGQPMVQQNQLIDIYNHFRLLTSESWSSQNRWNTIGFYRDVATAAGYSVDDTIYAPNAIPANNIDLNEGFIERIKYILDDAGLTFSGEVESVLSNLITKTEMAKLYVSHVSNVTAGTADTKSPVVQYSVKAIIMLKDIHPLFEVIPISKSLNFKIQIFWNNSVATATHDGSQWTSQSSQYRAYNGTMPLMLNNFIDGFAASPAGTLRVSAYVGDTCHDSVQKSVTSQGLTTGGVGKQVELWVPAYQMLPDVEFKYSDNHNRDISYFDYYQFTHKNIASGESFNHLVSNGISNLKAVFIVPFLSTTNTKSVTVGDVTTVTTVGVNNNVNLFDDGGPQLMAHINNFNVLVGGSNVLHQDSRYTYQQFNNEFFNEFGINGNQSPGLGSCLIDFKSWLKKPYYYVNCSRIPLEQQKLYRSLQIKGTNSSKLPIDYVIFAIYEKNFQLDVISGIVSEIK